MYELSYKQLNKLKYDSHYCINLYSYGKSALLETRHIVTEFNNAAHYIAENINQFTDTLQYCGWNWHIGNKTCSFDNNKNSGYPIYIVIDNNLDDNSFAYVEKRELSNNKIIMHININNIHDNDLESKLNHEFTHIRTSYSVFFMDPLASRKHRYDIKNISYYISMHTKKYSLCYFENSERLFLFNTVYIENAGTCLYYMSQTEQEARLNQTYKYIIQKYDMETLPSRKKLLIETNSIQLIDDFTKFYEDLELQFCPEFFRKHLCIAYYLNKYGYIKYKILNDETMLEYFNIFNIMKYQKIENNDLIWPINEAIEVIYKNLLVYKQKILNIIDDAICDIQQESVK